MLRLKHARTMPSVIVALGYVAIIVLLKRFYQPEVTSSFFTMIDEHEVP